MSTSEATREVIEDIKVIDVDTHWSEPYDLWTKRAPASLKERVPQLKDVGGRRTWVIEGSLPVSLWGGNCAISKENRKSRGLEFVAWGNEDAHPASYEVKARLALMNDTGIWAQIVYPNILGFGGQNTAKVDPALRLACAQIFNDAGAEMQSDSGQRIFPMALLPWWDLDAAVREAQRAHAMGLKGVNINCDPQNHRDAAGDPLPDLGHAYWDRLWEVCTDLELPVNFHIGASEQSTDWIGDLGWPSLSNEMQGAIAGAMMGVNNNGRVLSNIILSGLLDRHPKLRFVSVESGIGWIPFVLEGLDYQYFELNTNDRLELAPSEYFQRNFMACFWYERRDLSQIVKRVGVDNIMFETDFPHIVCLYPKPLEYLSEALATLDTTSRRKVMSGNAARVYKIPLA